MKTFNRIFRYIEPLWLGRNKKVSIRSVLALAFSIHFMYNVSYAVTKWDEGKSLEGLASTLIIEGSLIGALLALRTYSFTQADKLQAESKNPYIEPEAE